ncbi:hypothetical protein [Chengkuizengella sediminis]|uniref:hypothetical protein n=1 Tax=Chengkuizengella sediminis TaxID=1885917 RepID=UPI00138A19BF|nr:hypothetical protein [Chengkuizengella sediminis]NDI37244.1 hypothetical protein [Chengkuizengella sediminis]
MDKEDRIAGQNALSFLCIGAKIKGINFYGMKLLLSDNEKNSNRIDGQIYINIESEFSIYKSMPNKTPLLDDLPKLDWIEASKLLCELRLKKIVDVSLGNVSPHLSMTFETGEVLFIWGHHEQYESWQVGVYCSSQNNESWEVVACPSDGLAVFGPEDIINKNI